MNTYCYQYPYHLLLIVMLLLISWAFTFGRYKERYRVLKMPGGYIGWLKTTLMFHRIKYRIRKYEKYLEGGRK